MSNVPDEASARALLLSTKKAVHAAESKSYFGGMVVAELKRFGITLNASGKTTVYDVDEAIRNHPHPPSIEERMRLKTMFARAGVID